MIGTQAHARSPKAEVVDEVHQWTDEAGVNFGIVSSFSPLILIKLLSEHDVKS